MLSEYELLSRVYYPIPAMVAALIGEGTTT
jgi:hypothetical protein